MGPKRTFPLDEPAAGPLRAPSASEPSLAPAAARWPVLARIAELNRSSDSSAGPAPASTQTSYRVDAAHASATAPVQHASPTSKARPQQQQSAVAHGTLAPAAPENPARQDRVLRAAPLPIRAAIEAWHWIQPHQRLIRLAAMVTLMSVGGMAMFTIENHPVQPATTPHQGATATVESAVAPKLEIQHAEHNPAIVPASGPEAETDTLEPTATGPLPALSKPLMAVETDEPRPTLPYPTTVRPDPLEPIIAEGALPQAQFEEPAVARLKGTVEESQVR